MGCSMMIQIILLLFAASFVSTTEGPTSSTASNSTEAPTSTNASTTESPTSSTASNSTEAPTSTNASTTGAPSSTTASSTEASTSATASNSTEAPSSTTASNSTGAPTSTNASSTEASTSATASNSTEAPSSTTASSTEAPTSSTASNSTGAPTSTNASTTGAPTSSTASNSTEAPTSTTSTTEAPTSTTASNSTGAVTTTTSTTESPTSSTASNSTETPTSTTASSAEASTSATASNSTEAPSSTTASNSTEAPTSTNASNSTEAPSSTTASSTEAPTSSTASNSTEAPTSTTSTTETPTSTTASNSTEAPISTSASNSTEAPTSTSTSNSTEGPTSTVASSSTAAVTSTNASTTGAPTSTSASSSTEAPTYSTASTTGAPTSASTTEVSTTTSTTEAPTSTTSTTEAPTSTTASTTGAPTSTASTTDAPTSTASSTTEAPTSTASTTEAPTSTTASTTGAPTSTTASTTEAPTSTTSTTEAPTSTIASTTGAPTSTTASSTTEAPTSTVSTTEALTSTTASSTTEAPTSTASTTEAPTSTTGSSTEAVTSSTGSSTSRNEVTTATTTIATASTGDSKTTVFTETTTTTIHSTSTEIGSPCSSANCDPDGGECKTVDGAMSCVCYDGRTGIECTDYIASYGDWSEAGPCSSECGAAVRTSNRTCTNNADGTVRDVTDCESWGLGPSTKTEGCTGLPECTCNVHPCLDMKGDHTDAPCNSLGEKLHKCYEEFINTDPQNPVCLKKCVCADGFQRKLDPVTGDICVDINECKDATGACFNSTTDTLLSSVSSCVNSAGDYSCTCAQGYHHRSGNKLCEDVNECNDGTDECDDGDRATCTNTPGSYSCQCKTDFHGEGGKGSCRYEGRFILTDTSGMTEVKQEVSSLTYIPGGGLLSSDDETSVINSMYATRSGLIVFTSYKKGDPVQLAALAKPNIEKLLDWSVEKLNKINRNIVKVAAVYWADSIPAADGGIYTQWIPHLASSALSADTLAKFKDIHEHASWAYVVTWSNMAPNIKSTYSSDLNSFQAVVIGDAKKQTIKVRYFYGDRQMNWNLAIYGNPDLKFYPARIGVVFNARGGQPVAEEYKYSGLLTKDYTLTEWTNTEAGIIHPDRYNTDGEEEEVTSAGKFDYIITELPSSYDARSKTCRDWLDNQSEDELLKLASMECPGSLNQISLVLKGSYVLVEDVPVGHVCYKPVNPSTDRAGSLLYPRCCYDTLGSLLSNTISAVQSVNGKSTVLKIDTTETDDAEEIYWSCCDADYISSGQTPLSMCEEFLSHRPPGSSSQFHALSISQLRGDPHITSLDDVTYTFNGHGEFIMIESVNDTEFLFQGRTARVNGTGAATVFTGFAGQLAGGTIAEIGFSPTFSSVDLYLNGTKMNNFDWNTVSVEGNVRPYNDSGLYVMSFENGITARINANFDLEMMTLETIAEPSLADKLRGLLGNFNGEKGDEFRFPNGTLTLNSTSFTESEMYNWGLSWMTSDDNTLFTYDSETNWASYNFPDFRPTFFNANLTVMFPDADKRRAAIALCNNRNTEDENPELRKECYFDYKVTDNAALAEATVAASESLASEKSELNNFAPVFAQENVTLQVVAGETYSALHTLHATDDNGDNITYAISAGPSELSVSSEGVVTWGPVVYTDNNTVIITASDGSATASLSPQVAICNCQNEGVCQWEVTSTSNWYTVPCQCTAGWTGDKCDEDIDGCAEAPCFTACSDVLASKVEEQGSEFICDPCPAGLDGDGVSCYDVNECLTEEPCEHGLCENTAGSFLCSCNEGFALGPDGRSCLDINECLINKHDCNEKSVCTNTEGSYECTCKSGYEDLGTLEGCVNIDECSEPSVNCTVKSTCIDTDGSYVCQCLFGYRDTGNGCVNIDECALGNKCSQKCIDGLASYTCDCENNFSLNTTDLVTCHPDNECTVEETLKCDGGNNRSTCAKDGSGEIICACPQGFTADDDKNCVDIDECATGADICSPATSSCNNTEPGYSCVCKDGYQLSPNGITCEDVDECKDNSNNCDHYCSNTVGGFSCSCRSGYYLSSNGSSCINRNECELELTNQCDPLNGNCTDITDPEDGQLGYLCGCNSGYVLSEDGFTCNDLNECSLEDRGGCSQGCSNSKGSYTCYCGNGYALNTTDMMSCDDINECSSSATHNCYSDRFCTNTDGGYTCSCPDDFYLKSDGFTCVSLDTCKSGHSCSDTCSVINGTDTCQCSRGYLLAADNKTCQDVNECTEGLNICDSKYNVKCVNDEPGYHCACISDKYTQIEEAKCIDVDECSTGEAVCRDNSYCTNKENGYSCPCLTGFTDNVAGGCSDIKECLTGDNACHKTLATCTDFDGGYSCECKPGYTGDGVECTDINECAKTHSCDPNPDAGVCTNTPGSYSCSCRPGYEIQTSNLCLNIDECSNVVKYGVECSQVCIDTPGSVKCGCTDGYKLSADGLNCSPQVACSNKTICAHNCLKRNGVDTCTCNPGYSLDSADNSTCIDIDECATNTSSCDKNLGVCENVEGSYTCSCLNDFTVGPNGECEDRDGGFGEWSLFSNCTETCGEEGVQTRSRTCDSPSPEGKGAKCQGEDTESQPCNRILCEDQLEYGVQMELHGVTNTLFEVAEDVFTQKLATQINSYCISDSAAAQECCGVTFSLMSPENKTFLTYSDLEVSSRDIVDINGTVVVVTAEVDVTTNEVCTAISSGSRRKREISFVSQQLLLSILSDESFITEIVSVVETTLSHYNVTITNSPVFTSSKQVTLAPTTGSTTSDQATPTSTPSTANSTPAWVIAVSVVCGLLVVVAVAVAVVLLIKRPRKVSDGGNGHEVEANQNQANNHLTMPS